MGDGIHGSIAGACWGASADADAVRNDSRRCAVTLRFDVQVSRRCTRGLILIVNCRVDRKEGAMSGRNSIYLSLLT